MVHVLLIALASLDAEYKLSSWEAQAYTCNLPAPGIESVPPVWAGRLSTTEPPGEVLTEAYSSTPVIEVAGVMVTNENILLVLFEEGTSQLAVASESLSVLGALDPCRSAF